MSKKFSANAAQGNFFDPMPASDPPPVAPPPLNVRSWLTYFDDLHRHVWGVKAIIKKRDAAIMARIVREHGEDETEALLKKFFTRRDTWLRDNLGYTVATFAWKLPTLILPTRMRL